MAAVVEFYSHGVRTLAGSGMTLTGVRLSERGSWSLTLANGALLLLGHQRVDERLQRFLATFAQLSAAHPGGFQRVDLRYSNGFAILWAAASAPVVAPTSDQPTGAPPAAKAHT
jgi:cell division protein FtsQ